LCYGATLPSIPKGARMTLQQRSSERGAERDFAFSRQPRKFDPVEAVPLRWPTKISIANEYIEGWFSEARAAVGKKKLSLLTLETIASHVSRRDGSICLTDGAISARTGRSLSSTERDVQRIKALGFLVAEHSPIPGRQGRSRVLKLSVPAPVFVPQRIPPGMPQDCPSTYGGYVEGIDMGERRDV
jgi:hypothetical protein